mmetsp:Transcript_34105/g.81627  ORF Transcript_34105/g.81627 Transcript_34105/m.81627 type:complete len:165 (-) Transcript_34105:306-800(-)
MRGIQIAALSSLTYAQGFVFRASKSKPRFEQTSLFDGQSSGVQLVSLEGLGDDHETVGESMATSLASWLDDEWIPQDVHMKMGNRAKETYVRCRTNGIDDVAGKPVYPLLRSAGGSQTYYVLSSVSDRHTHTSQFCGGSHRSGVCRDHDRNNRRFVPRVGRVQR